MEKKIERRKRSRSASRRRRHFYGDHGQKQQNTPSEPEFAPEKVLENLLDGENSTKRTRRRGLLSAPECVDESHMDPEKCLDTIKEKSSAVKKELAKKDKRRIAPGTPEFDNLLRPERAKWHLDRARQLYWAGEASIESALQQMEHLKPHDSLAPIKAQLRKGVMMQASVITQVSPNQRSQFPETINRIEENIPLYAENAPAHQQPVPERTSAAKELFLGYALLRDYEMNPSPPLLRGQPNPKRIKEDACYGLLMGTMRMQPNRLQISAHSRRIWERNAFTDHNFLSGHDFALLKSKQMSPEQTQALQNEIAAIRERDPTKRAQLIENAKRRSREAAFSVQNEESEESEESEEEEEREPRSGNPFGEANVTEEQVLPKYFFLNHFDQLKKQMPATKEDIPKKQQWTDYAQALNDLHTHFPPPTPEFAGTKMTNLPYRVPGELVRPRVWAIYYPTGKKVGDHYVYEKPQDIGLPPPNYWDARVSARLLVTEKQHLKMQAQKYQIEQKQRELALKFAERAGPLFDIPKEVEMWDKGPSFFPNITKEQLPSQKFLENLSSQKKLAMINHALYQLGAPPTPWMIARNIFSLGAPGTFTKLEDHVARSKKGLWTINEELKGGWKTLKSPLEVVEEIDFVPYDQRAEFGASRSRKTIQHILSLDGFRPELYGENDLVWGNFIDLDVNENFPSEQKTMQRVRFARSNQSTVLGTNTWGLDFYLFSNN